MSSCDQLRVYIGDTVENAGERRFLEDISAVIERGGGNAVVLANFQCAGRQIDFVIATESGAALFEVKSSNTPLRGQINGDWEKEKQDGNWTLYRNGYQQALNAKNRLRDEMRKFKEIGGYYPAAFVTFPFGLAEGSELTRGDNKVAVQREDLVSTWLNGRGGFAWSLNDWERFAESLSLKRVEIAGAIANADDEHRREILARYKSAFLDEHAPQASEWLPESEDDRSSVWNKLNSPHGAFIHGPSGCGKTLLTKSIACRLTESGSPCVLVSAKEYSGDWRACLRREVGLLIDDSIQELLAIFRNGRAPTYLILDGLNELDADSQARAVRGIGALARKFGFRIIVTSQLPPPRSLKALTAIEVLYPSAPLKRAIAESSGKHLNSPAIEALSAVKSGFEASIVGQIGALDSGFETRPRLVDQFIRSQLGEFARDGSRACRYLASLLSNRIAFSIGEVELDDLLLEVGVSVSALDALFNSGLLVRRGGRVSFRHEILQSACAAFELSRKVSENPETMGHVLSLTRFAYLAKDVVSALESPEICTKFLSSVTDSGLIAQAAIGNLGAIAKQAAETLVEETTSSVIEEISCARLTLTGEDASKVVGWEPSSLSKRTDAEISRLRALGRIFLQGQKLPTYLEMCRLIDARLTVERKRLFDDAKRYNVAIKSGGFALAHNYGFCSSEIGFTTIAATIRSSFGDRRLEDQCLPASLLPLSSSEIYFFLESKRYARDCWDNEDFSVQLCEFLERRFRYEPYHLQLTALDACLGLWEISTERKERLISAVQDILENTRNWAISTQAIDILRSFGALDDDVQNHRAIVRENIQSVLSGHQISLKDRADLALGVYVGQFDHALSTAYCEEWNALTEEQHKSMLRWAIRSDGLARSLGYAWIVHELSEFDDPTDIETLKKVTELPDPKSSHPQDSISAFLVACRVFGRHNTELPKSEVSKDVGAVAFSVFGEIMHIIGQGHAVGRSHEVWMQLNTLPADRVLGCLGDIQSALDYWPPESNEAALFSRLNFVQSFPEFCLGLSRRFLDDMNPALGYRGEKSTSDRHDALAFQIIEKYGDREDIDRLRKAMSVPKWEKHAISVIRKLDTIAETH